MGRKTILVFVTVFWVGAVIWRLYLHDKPIDNNFTHISHMILSGWLGWTWRRAMTESDCQREFFGADKGND